MTNQVHLAAQYLATAGINFLEKKEDDSHTNLGFNSEKGYLETWPLNDDGCRIAFDYQQFSLHWLTKKTKTLTFLLDGKTHKEVIRWMRKVTLSLVKKEPYTYELHYDLPYEKINDDFTFHKPSQNELNSLLQLRKISQGALKKVVNTMNLETTIRIWPHHFDIGGFAVLGGENNISVGFGMAIPDEIIDDFYLYTSGYIDHDGIETTYFKNLSKGNWINNNFKGAVLAMKNVDKSTAITFFEETIQTYKNCKSY